MMIVYRKQKRQVDRSSSLLGLRPKKSGERERREKNKRERKKREMQQTF
jgi:hypothetical protein